VLDLDVSVVIVSYNTRDVLRRCIDSLVETTRRKTYEIIVVDNCSKDGSADMIATEYPWIRLLRSPSNVGFAAGQNRGLLGARGRFCLVLNSDVLFRDNSLDGLVTYLDESPADIGVVGPRIVNPDGSLAPSARRVTTSAPMLALSIVNRHFPYANFLPQRALRRMFGPLLSRVHDNFSPHREVQEAEYVDGMCVLIRRRVFETVGLFDEQFFFDFEIADWSIRAHRAGWRILYYPGAEVMHLGHTSRRLVRRIVLETHRSELIYFTKHFPAQLLLIRRTGILVVGLRYVLTRCVLACRRSPKVADASEMCGRILKLLRSFDPTSVSKNGAIPIIASKHR
jgi:GT2 family glycosyltransferase